MSTARAFSGRHVDDPGGAVDRRRPLVGPVEAVDAHEEPGERLARAGGRGDQRVVARGDVGPALGLWGGGALGEPAPEPLRDGRVESGQGRVRVSTDPRPQRELHRRGSHLPLFNLMGTTFIPVHRQPASANQDMAGLLTPVRCVVDDAAQWIGKRWQRCST